MEDRILRHTYKKGPHDRANPLNLEGITKDHEGDPPASLPREGGA
jgi:hypothetical protein